MKKRKNQLITILMLVMGLILCMLYFEAARGSIAKQLPEEDFKVLAIWQIGEDNMGILLKHVQTGDCWQYIGPTPTTPLIIQKVTCPI